MSATDFADRSVPLIVYSRALDSAVFMRSTDPLLLSMAKRRLAFYSDYLKKIGSLDPEITIQPVVFSAIEQDNIFKIKRASDGQMRGILSPILVIADQELIGVHVLATGSVGLKDAVLRSWASDQLRIFISDLDESQKL